MALAAALRGNSTLTSLELQRLAPIAAPVVAALLGALVAHRSLRTLDVCHTLLELDAAAVAALAALVAADAPALTELSFADCDLDEACLGALCDALPSNSHLRKLNIGSNYAPAGFMRARMLPAVRGNASLRRLQASIDPEDNDDERAHEEAQRILAARRRADGIIDPPFPSLPSPPFHVPDDEVGAAPAAVASAEAAAAVAGLHAPLLGAEDDGGAADTLHTFV